MRAKFCISCTESLRKRQAARSGKKKGPWYEPCTASSDGRHTPNLQVETWMESTERYGKEWCTACGWSHVFLMHDGRGAPYKMKGL